MKRLIAFIAVSLTLTAGLLLNTLPASAQVAKTPETTAEGDPKPAAPRARPVTGKVDALDKTAKTITLSGEKKQVLHVTAETKIVKAGKPATFDDLVVGEVIGGSVVEVDGKLRLNSLRIGPKPAEEPK